MSRSTNDFSAAQLGAIPLDNHRCRFRVWASKAARVEVHLPVTAEQPERTLPLLAIGAAGERGYFEAVVENCPHGTRYTYRLGGACERPDPASRWQPEGVHNASAVFDWRRFPADATGAMTGSIHSQRRTRTVALKVSLGGRCEEFAVFG